jgi:hypothetical protein
MSSKTEVVATVANVVSTVAVVISLALLVASVRENTAILKATSAAASRDSLATMNDWALMLGEKHFDLILRSEDGAARLNDFTETEQLYLVTAQRSFFRRAEAQYFRYRNGLLDEDAWQTVRHRVWYNIKSPVDRDMWREERLKVYTPGFVESIESYRPTKYNDATN